MFGGIIFISFIYAAPILIRFKYSFFLFITIGAIGGIFLVKGYKGLKNTQNLKDEKIDLEITLLKKQVEQQKIINDQLIEKAAQNEAIFPIFERLKEIQRGRVKKRLEKSEKEV